MKIRYKYILENKWWHELIILLFSFILFTLNDWIFMISADGLGKAFCYFLLLYAHAQLNRFFILPILLKAHRPFLYLLSSTVLVLLFSIVLYEITNQWLYKDCFLYKSVKQNSYLFQLTVLIATLICIMCPILLLKFYREEKKKTVESLLNKEIQLKALRNQLNPHFLFNTFNTLYGISLQDPKRTPDLIMQVSQLMRYQLETNTKRCVTMDDELIFINSYINLEKERLGYRCEIKYNFNIENPAIYKISPMLLITFIENAFKHGTCAIESCFVHISAHIEEDRLFFKVVNSIPKKKTNIVSTKIGIKNVMERLNIIYANNYNLDIQKKDNIYTVNLDLQLKRVSDE
ncbi:sensor histidine kinase [Flavobacterium sp. '19STA2R22 D10 B1']|uniref:sensor histidine kinase n=1 Tax=Flavobacterium aerium TaxID=3037261 RepID=UPI00278C46C1|nr:histidine kinase [Flavobacterium sp. '19STA2R22 D10 B1']